MEDFGKQLKNNFNSTTVRGRANVAKATYGTFALMYLYYRMTRPSKKKVPTASAECLKSCPACPGGGAGAATDAAVGGTAGAEAGTAACSQSNGTAAGAAKGSSAAGAAKGASAAKAVDTAESGKVNSGTGTDKNKSATAGAEPNKPCKRVEPKQFYDT